ncbi:hypothetical protein [Peribacillus frigoritolerans]|uniref:hypothetical protein n=1 Tax=Peribacillus frigoritolerans TaxID=450367 RepID=UPI00216230A2|nr:hypothetical protein [Peribacillus frigoritolerans]
MDLLSIEEVLGTAEVTRLLYKIFTGWFDRLNQLCRLVDSWILRWKNQSTNAPTLKSLGMEIELFI